MRLRKWIDADLPSAAVSQAARKSRPIALSGSAVATGHWIHQATSYRIRESAEEDLAEARKLQ